MLRNPHITIGLPRSSVAHHWFQPMSGGGVCGSKHPVGMEKTARNAGSLKELTTKNME